MASEKGASWSLVGGVRTSHGRKEAMIENTAYKALKKENREVVGLYYDFQKAYDNASHASL